jgi:uncharacterized protein YecT (DUF1311 family)
MKLGRPSSPPVRPWASAAQPAASSQSGRSRCRSIRRQAPRLSTEDYCRGGGLSASNARSSYSDSQIAPSSLKKYGAGLERVPDGTGWPTMRRGEYIETAEGQAHRYGWRKLQRIYAHVPEEPLSKKALRNPRNTAHKTAFQATALEWRRRLDLQPLRGPAVVDFTFTPAGPNPPSIEKLPKSYLDLLERRVDSVGSFTDERLVFRDDRQVKVLFVRYHMGLDASPEVRATITARRHFIADVELAARLDRGDFQDSDTSHRRRRWSDDHERIFGHRDEQVDQAFEELRELECWSPAHRAQFGEAYEAMFRFALYKVQRAWLANTDDAIGSILLGLPSLWRRMQPTFLVESLKSTRGLLIGGPLAVSVMHAPRRDGDSTLFEVALEKALAQFARSHKVLFPLLTQLGVTMFHIPPRPETEGIDGKDLDNLARLVIPKVQETFKPPSTLWQAHRLALRTPSVDPAISAWVQKEIDLHKRLPAIGVSRYCAIELPRVPDDPDDGMVAVAFGDGEQIPSLWDDIDGFIKEWKSSLS